MKEQIIAKHMQASYYYAKLSSCKKRQVGCLVVKEDRIISVGYNGTPRGWDNNCEDEKGNTLPHVFHAETNAITKLARSTESCERATLFVTLEPCFECAKLLVQCGIERVYFCEEKNENGTSFLLQSGVKVFKFLENPLQNENAKCQQVYE